MLDLEIVSRADGYPGMASPRSVQRQPGDLAGAVAVIAVRRLAERAGQLPLLRLVAPLDRGVGDDVIRPTVRADRRGTRSLSAGDLRVGSPGRFGRLLMLAERIEK